MISRSMVGHILGGQAKGSAFLSSSLAMSFFIYSSNIDSIWVIFSGLELIYAGPMVLLGCGRP